MEGIQLLGVPSRNLNARASKRCAQNIGTSGSEIRKPPSAKMFAIQRIASLFSLGTNRSTKRAHQRREEDDRKYVTLHKSASSCLAR